MARSWLTAGHGEGVFKLSPLSFNRTRPVATIQTLAGDKAGVFAHAQTPAYPSEKTGVPRSERRRITCNGDLTQPSTDRLVNLCNSSCS